ncbi:transcriptional regulator, TetR family [Micromonospora pattaloongensis]|uniref:Transcriptional regulator, TetR family n=2 Tax=Micromonospora pattaloongensis TaxID=405436 RepID=A0A1H3SQQ5_9ACTN|nr:transcriptional regulator, TetR family [Micromonospora pattaloongensis]
MALADADGVAALSMRAVAQRLGLSSMALYPYVGSKDGLLDGLVDLLVADLVPTLPAGDGDGDWRERLRGLARAVRRIGHAHPGAYALMMGRPSTTPDAARLVELLYRALLDAGVPPPQVPRLERLLTTLVLGFVAAELNGRFASRHPDRGPAADAAELPAHAALDPELRAEVDWDAEFEADLDDGIRLIELTAATSAARAATPVAAG